MQEVLEKTEKIDSGEKLSLINHWKLGRASLRESFRYFKNTAIRLGSASLDDRTETKETIGSKAFRMEYDPNISRSALYDDVVTYLAEYRLQAQEMFYQLKFSAEEDEWHIRDVNTGKSLVETAQEVIKKDSSQIVRRYAELQGLQKEEDFLIKAKPGDITIQISPPGDDLSETGDYGFIFVGKVEEENDGSKIWHKNAIRINKANLEQYSQLFGIVTKEPSTHKTAEEFIRDPKLLQNTSYQEVQAALLQVFDFKTSSDEKKRNEWIINQVKPHVFDFIDMVKQGKSHKKSYRHLQKIENRLLELKDKWNEGVINDGVVEILNSKDLDRDYDFDPPEASGSCGPTDSANSNSRLRSLGLSSVGFNNSALESSVGEDQYGTLVFDCPKGHKNKRPYGKLIPRCQTCGTDVRC